MTSSSAKVVKYEPILASEVACAAVPSLAARGIGHLPCEAVQKGPLAWIVRGRGHVADVVPFVFDAPAWPFPEGVVGPVYLILYNAGSFGAIEILMVRALVFPAAGPNSAATSENSSESVSSAVSALS